MKDLNYFKNALKAILDKQEKEEQVINKALTLIETIQKGRRPAYEVNAKVTWKGKKYVKCADKKWRRYYDKEERGTKVAAAFIKREIDKATSGEELMRIALKHRGRFSDEWGAPLPILDELRAYIDNRQDDFDNGKTSARTKAEAKRANVHVKYRGIQKYMKEQAGLQNLSSNLSKMNEEEKKEYNSGYEHGIEIVTKLHAKKETVQNALRQRELLIASGDWKKVQGASLASLYGEIDAYKKLLKDFEAKVHNASAKVRSTSIKSARQDDEIVGLNTIKGDIPEDEKKFYTMTRKALKDYITDNIADVIENVDKAETKTLADFCRAHTRVKELVPNMPKVKYFNGYRRAGNALAVYANGGICASRLNVAMLEYCENTGAKNDKERNESKVVWNIVRNSGNAIRDVFIHEFGHFFDYYCGGRKTFLNKEIQVFKKSKKDGTCVSEYGGADIHKNHKVQEFVAECFASYVIFGKASLTSEQCELVEKIIDSANKKKLQKGAFADTLKKSMEENVKKKIKEDGIIPTVEEREYIKKKAKQLKKQIKQCTDPEEKKKLKEELKGECVCY